MQPDSEVIALAQRAMLRLAENIGDPHLGRAIAEAAKNLEPSRPGPSSSFRTHVARQKAIIVEWKRQHRPSASPSAAAREMRAKLDAYHERRWPFDRDNAERPSDEFLGLAYDRLQQGKKLPSFETMRKDLS